MIHIITAVHNRYDITQKFVDNLLKQTYNDIHLVLVDDGSTDGTADMVLEKFPNTTILQGNGDLWWGGAMQMAYEWIKRYANAEDYVLFSNDDVCYEEDYVEKGVALLDENPDTLISGVGKGNISKRTVDLPMVWDFSKGKGEAIKSFSQEGNCVSTRSLFVAVKTVVNVGGFHPILIPHYMSDYAWTIKAAKKGYKIKAFESLQYYFSEETTGLRNRKKMSLKQLFSKKSNANPLYRLAFLIVVTPLHKLPFAIYHQVRRIEKIK